jgi:hypothetical protein
MEGVETRGERVLKEVLGMKGSATVCMMKLLSPWSLSKYLVVRAG